MEEKKEWKKKIPMWIKEGLFEEVTDDRGTRILGYVNCSDKVLDFIEQEIDRAREEGYEEAKKDMAVGVGLVTDTELPEIVRKIASKLKTKE